MDPTDQWALECYSRLIRFLAALDVRSHAVVKDAFDMCVEGWILAMVSIEKVVPRLHFHMEGSSWPPYLGLTNATHY